MSDGLIYSGSFTEVASTPHLGVVLESQFHCDILGHDILETRSGYDPLKFRKKLMDGE